ncbi:hypothetical protein L9F63_009367, partial [Diploptera punctata]
FFEYRILNSFHVTDFFFCCVNRLLYKGIRIGLQNGLIFIQFLFRHSDTTTRHGKTNTPLNHFSLFFLFCILLLFVIFD